MDFLVKIDTSQVYKLSNKELDDLLIRERRKGHQYIKEGIITNFWRIPGTSNNIGVWSARDADELEVYLNALPVRPYVTIDITLLSTHPLIKHFDYYTP